MTTAAEKFSSPLYLDSREPPEFEGYLTTLGLPLYHDALGKLPTLEYGDMAFLGTGPDGCPTPIGIERKSLSDFINSCRSERLQGHQLPGMALHYQQVWVVVEGFFKVEDGIVMVPAGYHAWKPLPCGGPTVTFRELFGRVLTLQSKTSVRVQWTDGKKETASWLNQLYRWWEVGWDQHASHVGFAEVPGAGAAMIKWDRSNPRHIVRLMAKELAGVGWEKAANIAGQFNSASAMVQASQKEWEAVPGIGPVLAKRIVKVLQGG